MSTFVAVPIQRAALNDYGALERNFRDAESDGSRIERAVLLTKDGPYMVRGFGVSQLKGEVTFDKGHEAYDGAPASVSGSISLTTQTRPIIPRVFGSIAMMLSGVGSLGVGSILVMNAAHAATSDLTTQIAGGIAAVIAGADLNRRLHDQHLEMARP